jgi:hypothetical protein
MLAELHCMVRDVPNHNFINLFNFYILITDLPVPVAERSKALVYSRSPAAILGSNPTGDMDVCLLCVLCVVR